jgi:DNA-binding response OmpR family regulator
MGKIIVVDTVGDSLATLRQALGDAGWEVVVEEALECCVAPADAIVFATDAVGLARSLGQVQAVRTASGMPIILIIDLDRSGWDRTFSAPEALSADALLDKPVNGHALVQRLRGILAARAAAREVAPGPDEAALFDQALANEEAAAAFYRRAAQSVARADTREALEALGRDEEEHERLLREFRSGARALPTGSTHDGALVETWGVPAFSPEMTPADAFLLAAQKERLAIALYENWAQLYPPGPDRDLLLRFAEVERRHKEHVEAMFSNAAFPEVW